MLLHLPQFVHIHLHQRTQQDFSMNPTVSTDSSAPLLIMSSESYASLLYDTSHILYIHLVSAVIYRAADCWLQACVPYRKISSAHFCNQFNLNDLILANFNARLFHWKYWAHTGLVTFLWFFTQRGPTFIDFCTRYSTLLLLSWHNKPISQH